MRPLVIDMRYVTREMLEDLFSMRHPRHKEPEDRERNFWHAYTANMTRGEERSLTLDPTGLQVQPE